MMRMQSLLTNVYTSDEFIKARRLAYSSFHQIFCRRRIIRYFHQVDDPYSCIAIQALAYLQELYNVKFELYLVPPPDDSAVPRRDMLCQYSFRDAQLLAKTHALQFPHKADNKLNAEDIILANAIIVAAEQKRLGIQAANLVTQALWAQDMKSLKVLGERYGVAAPEQVLKELSHGHTVRKSYGHYSSATFQFEGEWYWGIDRLPYLESRLIQLGLNKDRASTLPNYSFKSISCPFKYSLPEESKELPKKDTVFPSIDKNKPQIELWFSFRSPYVWISLPRIRALAKQYDAQIHLRYIMPMVMRGLPVPLAKELYIVEDVKREANRCGIPFGYIADPAGAATERAMAVLYQAINLGRGEEFAESAFKGIFADGIDLSTDDGLLFVAERAGLNDEIVTRALANDKWRVVADKNLKQLYEIGLWGEPTFRVNGGLAYWGQDRLWKLEEDLRLALKPKIIPSEFKSSSSGQFFKYSDASFPMQPIMTSGMGKQVNY